MLLTIQRAARAEGDADFVFFVSVNSLTCLSAMSAATGTLKHFGQQRSGLLGRAAQHLHQHRSESKNAGCNNRGSPKAGKKLSPNGRFLGFDLFTVRAGLRLARQGIPALGAQMHTVSFHNARVAVQASLARNLSVVPSYVNGQNCAEWLKENGGARDSILSLVPS
jgi:hypothetical protein